MFSARIISTDVPLLFFWALALLAYVKLLAGADTRWGIVLGAAFGFGLMAKYEIGRASSTTDRRISTRPSRGAPCSSGSTKIWHARAAANRPA